MIQYLNFNNSINTMDGWIKALSFTPSWVHLHCPKNVLQYHVVWWVFTFIIYMCENYVMSYYATVAPQRPLQVIQTSEW